MTSNRIYSRYILSVLLGITLSGIQTCWSAEEQLSPKVATTATPIQMAKALGDVFAGVTEKVGPAVVVIHITRGEDRGGSGENEPDPHEMYRRKPSQLPPEPSETKGSGFIVRKDGYIYTNSHVIENADKIVVRLKDGREFDGKVIGEPDEKTDVAVIKINATNLPVVELGDSDQIRPGEWTIAIGAPFNLDYSVTVGVLSGKVRDKLGATTYEEFLQTQATINPGNSGGPLLDVYGKVIGINTLIRTRYGGGFGFYNANVGFAIPINLAKKIGDLLISKGKVDRPWIGVNIRSLEDAPELKPLLPGIKEGVVVMAIPAGTPASDSKLKPLDVITEIEKTPVTQARQLQQQVLRTKIGDSVSLTVIRDGKPIKVSVKTGLQPTGRLAASIRSTIPQSVAPSYGVTLQTVNQELMDQYGLKEKKGAMVIDVEDGSLAARSGMIPGMVVTELDGKRISSSSDFRKAMQKADLKNGSVLQAELDGTRLFLIIKLTSQAQPMESPGE